MAWLGKLSKGMKWDKNDPESMELYIMALEADYVSLETRSKMLMLAQEQGFSGLVGMWHKVPGIFKFWI